MAFVYPAGNNHLFPPGPCEIAVATASRANLGLANAGWEFLGTTREGGRAQEVLYSGNIPADYAGSDGMPADIRLSGKGLVIVCQVQNFNPAVMRRLKTRYWGNIRDLIIPGQIDTSDIGGLLMQEGRYIPLCIRSMNGFTKYPTNESGLWVPMCFPSGEMGWDYAAREQVYSLTFLGLTYMNMTHPGTGGQTDPQGLNCAYNEGFLYSVDDADISRIWGVVTNPAN
jgi:hypothetical protein